MQIKQFLTFDSELADYVLEHSQIKKNTHKIIMEQQLL